MIKNVLTRPVKFLSKSEKHSSKIGAAPGTLHFIGRQKISAPLLEKLSWNENEAILHQIANINEESSEDARKHKQWFNLAGLHDLKWVQEIGTYFNVHKLVLEDILNTSHRPKFEDEGNALFIVLKMLRLNHSESEAYIDAEQISLLIYQNHLLLFQETNEDVFKPIRDRLLNATTRIRSRGTDYLAYALLDAIIDHYIMIIEELGDKVEQLEQDLLNDPKEVHLQQIKQLKIELNYLRKTIRPVMEVVVQFRKSESVLINADTYPYLQDLQDHIVHATESIELYREMLKDQLDMYNSFVANKLNDIMRVLTIFSVIFIPMTFLAGIYGTNFEYLPELSYRYAYPIFWAVMLFMASSMLFFFKRKKWL
jgi:magnesium transporter